MNTVQCSNCGTQNPADLRFCTNCGNPLPATNFGQTPPNSGAAPAAKSKTGRNAAIIGALGCLVLLVGAVALCGILGYIGSNSANNTSTNNLVSNVKADGNDNLSLTNRGIKVSNSNSGVFDNSNLSPSNRSNTSASNSNSSTGPTDEEFNNFLPSEVGDYERQGDAIEGNITEDFPGADKIIKSNYVKKNKKVAVVMAQFASPSVAKQSYGYFLNGFKSAGAKVLLSRKVKNKSGVEIGELSIYTYKGAWETMVYAERFGFRITTSDRATLSEFLKAFGSYLDFVGDK